ncbi:hypothetical protein BST61_g10020 [Cercospora zeina]
MRCPRKPRTLFANRSKSSSFWNKDKKKKKNNDNSSELPSIEEEEEEKPYRQTTTWRRRESDDTVSSSSSSSSSSSNSNECVDESANESVIEVEKTSNSKDKEPTTFYVQRVRTISSSSSSSSSSSKNEASITSAGEKRFELIDLDTKAAIAAARQESSQSPRPPTQTEFVFIILAVVLAHFCTALDSTIVPTAIPRIADEFGSLGDVGLYGSGYLLGICAFQRIWEELYTVWSLKWVFVGGSGIFELGVAIAGLATDSRTLIFGRVVAGVGVAGISQGASLIMTSVVGMDKRPMYSRVLDGVAGAGSVLGPILGGILADHVSWRWCFHVNLLLGAIAISFTCVFYSAPPPTKTFPIDSWKAKLEQFDIFGLLVFLPMIFCLLWALQWGGSQLPWNSGQVVELFVIFGVLFLTWTGIQYWKQDYATIPPRLIRQRTVASAAWVGD